MHKKGHKLKTSPLIKNPQFSSNVADINAKLPTHEVVILTKFHKDGKKNVDFLLTQKFLVCALFYASPAIIGRNNGMTYIRFTLLCSCAFLLLYHYIDNLLAPNQT